MSRSIHDRFLVIAGEVSPRLESAIALVGPRRFRRRNDQPLSEVLCRIIAGQQLSTKAAATIWGRLVDSAGEQPLIEFVATAQPQQLRDCGMSRSKAKTMKEIVHAEATGRLDAQRLGRLNHQQRAGELMQIWGVGQWTADIVSLSYFGEKDVWPASDITVCNTLQRLTSRRRKTERTAARFAPHRSYLALYMWTIADSKPQ